MPKYWFEYDYYRDFQQKFDFATYEVQGVDIPMPCDTAITSIFDGTIVSLYYDNGGGQIVIKIADTIFSRGIPYYGFAHFDAIDMGLSVGSRISAGQVLGWSGGQNIGQAVGQLPIGYSHHYAATNYSNGAHIELFLSKTIYIPYLPQDITDDLNPYWLLDYAKSIFTGSGTLPTGRIQLSDFTYSSSTVKSTAKIYNQVDDTTSLDKLLGNIDISMKISNPFDIKAKQDTFGPLSFTDPVDWIGQFFSSLFGDIMPIIMRIILIVLGVFVIYHVISEMIDINLSPSAAGKKSKSLGVAAVKAIL